MYSNAVEIIRSFCLANGHPISTGPLKWDEIEAYASVAKAQYRALPDQVKVSLANVFTYPVVVPYNAQPHIIVESLSPVPPALVEQIEAYQENPLPGT